MQESASTPYYHFFVLRTGNGVSLDFLSTDDEIVPQHYAFLVSEKEFDEIFGRIQQRGLPFWADPGRKQPGVINSNDGGRGLYFADPANNYLEILTRP
jgi:extradiol dioxygenase family protein